MPTYGPEETAQLLEAIPDGFRNLLGLRFVLASDEEVVGEIELGERHFQPYGIVHGGVYASVFETLASAGAALSAMKQGLRVVGLENHTSFVRAAGPGVARAVARPITRGRRSQLWEATAHDAEGRVLATGRVRLLVLEPEALEPRRGG